ncbi:hypothetical protein [Oxalicibacterium solurbis]|uniref:Uncharacterized protein n=1 Tax=Oxalicibacterium solurbis TaxID=69280 RepID=A0A8J3B5R2_9BURK|nr:hypothetical protein [Oxalicibacterium solurbis]GGI55590.1 hypothetical protein GCM10011430_27640 [Oxalicibacterium solurbis]
MSAIEYCGYRIEVFVEEQDWGFASGQWRGGFRFWRDGGAAARACTISRTERSAYDARQKALRIAMSFIRAEIAMEEPQPDEQGRAASHRAVVRYA